MLYQMVLVFQVTKQKLGKVACRPWGLIRCPRRNDSLALQASIVQTGLFLSITLPWESLKILKNQSPGPDAVVYGPYRYKTWWYADVFFIYRLDPREKPKRKWKPRMSLSQCLTLITIANFGSKGTSRREHSERGSARSSVSNYIV